MNQHPNLKILLITRNLPPLVGGMERLLYHIYLELRKSFQVAIAGPHSSRRYIAAGTPFKTFPISPAARFFLSSIWQSYRLASTFSPDLILSGSGVTSFASAVAGKLLKRPVICYLHGLDLVEKNPAYRLFCIPAIRSCDAVLVNSNSTAQLAKAIGVRESSIQILHPGVSLPHQKVSSTDGFRNQLGVGSRPILLSVGRLTRRKGIVEFIDRCLPDIIRSNPEVVLVIIGEEATSALKQAPGVLSEIRTVVSLRGLTDHVRLLGHVDDATLSQAYLASQLLVFPVIERPNDIEGFGMVAVEAAAHGLPTMAFALGGVIDAVKDAVSGYLVTPGDYKELTRSILHQLHSPQVSKSSCIAFADSFSWERFGNRLREISLSTAAHHQTQFGE